MKVLKVSLVMLIPVLLMNSGNTYPENNKNTLEVIKVEPIEAQKPVTLENKPIKLKVSLEKLVAAMIQVESRGNDSIIGDKHIVGGESAGALQIRPIMVKEVNRILKKQKSTKRYKLKDRFNRTKTVEMFMIWKNYHHKNSSNEKIARCWNGGPKGWKRKSTEYYWSKVQKELDI